MIDCISPSTRMLTMRVKTPMVTLQSLAQWFFNTLLKHAIEAMASTTLKTAGSASTMQHSDQKIDAEKIA